MNQNLLPQARTNNLVTQEMPDEILVYDLKNHKAHCLNQTAAAVWKYCDGKTSVTEIAALIKQDINQTIDETSVWQAIERLSNVNLLETRVTPPAGIPRLGRREALRRLGLGSAIAVPVVMTILAPTVLAGCTFANQPNGDPCCTDGQCSSTCCAVGTCATAGNITAGNPCTAPCVCQSGTCSGSPLVCQP
ncbi:MAG: PqqD family protein [Acidobacteria bacterium]|nr:PqqD family protein [Acidobacteriota bacterium]